MCKVLKVNIACALRWGVASVGITLLGMAHLIWDNISSAGHTPVGGSHPRSKDEESWLVPFIFYFVKFLEQTSSGMYL